jgi:hypothetical protein
VNITEDNVTTAERLTELALKIFLFFFVLLGVTVFSGFFIYCVMNGKGVEAKAIAGVGDLVFFGAFGWLVRYFFFRKNISLPQGYPGSIKTIHATAPAARLGKKHRAKGALSEPSDPL